MFTDTSELEILNQGLNLVDLFHHDSKRVDWDRFGEKFDAIDDDSSGSLEFRACAMHGSPLAFASEPVLTVGLPTARAVWARLRR